MKKNISFQNVSYACNIGRANRKVIKKLSIDIKDNNVFSFVANNIEKKALIKLISNKTNDIWGNINYSGDYFNKFKNKQDAFFTLDYKNNRLNRNLNQELTILNFLKLDKKNNHLIKLNLSKEINLKKAEIKKTNDDLKNISSKKGFLNNEFLEKDKTFEKFKNTNNKLIKTQLEYRNRRIFFIGENKKIIIKRIKLTSLFEKNKKFITKKHNKKVNWQRISTSREIDKVLEAKSIEKKLNNNKEEKFKTIEINSEVSLKKFRKLLFSFEKLVSNSFDNKLINSKEYILKQNIMKSSKNIYDLFTSFVWINKFVEKNLLFLNKDKQKEIKNKLKSLFTLKNKMTELNSVDFSRFIKYARKEFSSKLNYYENIILDIEKRLRVVDKEDQKEKLNFMRKSWEFERVSLKYQAQLYKEKIFIVKKYQSELKRVLKTIPYLYNDKAYDKYIEYLEVLLLIDVAITKWRKQRGIKSEKLYLSQQIKTQNDLFRKNKEEIAKLNKLLINPVVFNAVNDSYVEQFQKIEYNNMKSKLLKDLSIEESEKQNKIIIKYKKRIKELENELSILEHGYENIDYNIRNYAKDLVNTSLGDKIKINTLLNELKDTEKSKLIVLKEIIKGKKIIIISDLEMLGNPSDVSKFVNKIKEKYHVTFIFFTKNIDAAIKTSDYIAVIYKGIIVEFGSGPSFLENKHHEYTLRILDDVQNKYISSEQNDWEIKLGNRFSGFKLTKIAEEHWIFENSSL